MTLFTAEPLDLSRLPAQTFVGVDEDAERLSLIAAIQARFDARGVPYDVAMLRTDPYVILAEEFAFRRTLSTAAINDGIARQYLATSYGAALDHLAVTLYPDVGLRRLPAVPEPRPYATNPEDWESDPRFKRRLGLAGDARAPATPGAYLLAALSHSIDVADAAVLNHASGLVERGEILVVVLGKPGADHEALAAAVDATIRARAIEIETDTVYVRAAARRVVAVTGTLEIRRGPDGARVAVDRTAAVHAFGAARRQIGRTVPARGLGGAMSSDLVETVSDVRVDGVPLTADLVPPPDGVIEIGSVALIPVRHDG